MDDSDDDTRNVGGRPSRYDPGFVRDVSMQVLYAFYNERQHTLRDQIRKDPDYVSKMRHKARYFDSIVRAWLDALAHVPANSPNYLRELMFYQWAARLEPPMSVETLSKLPLFEKELREQMEKHFTDEYWRVNCKRWVDAIKRVREDKCVKLKIPSVLTEAEDEDEYL